MNSYTFNKFSENTILTQMLIKGTPDAAAAAEAVHVTRFDHFKVLKQTGVQAVFSLLTPSVNDKICFLFARL